MFMKFQVCRSETPSFVSANLRGTSETLLKSGQCETEGWAGKREGAELHVAWQTGEPMASSW